MENLEGMIVVSNRLPFVLQKTEGGGLRRKSCAGGLVTGVAPTVVKHKGIWVGWPGIQLGDNEIPEWDEKEKSSHLLGLKSNHVFAVNVDDETFDDYYNGCCNACMWPLFHSMPEKTDFKQKYWDAYVECNEVFAQRTVDAIFNNNDFYKNQGSVTIWVHDYHLLIAPKYIRELTKGVEFGLKVAFFLHIPFPTWDILRLMPWATDIITGILECDMIGFHIRDYCLNFLECCTRGLGLKVNNKALLVEYEGRSIHVCPLPIGIPFKHFVEMAQVSPAVFTNKNEKIILGVDRMDYTKGIPQKFLAFKSFLKKYPEFHKKVVFIQVAVPSRPDVQDYIDLRNELQSLAGFINGEFSTVDWAPIRLICRMIQQFELAGMYRDADAILVTPLRDGMNLVAKEYCACQSKTPPGVLIISPFAGAAETMPEALVLNPYYYEEGADVIHKALTMLDCEKISRMEKLKEQVKTNDVVTWANNFVCIMNSITPSQTKQIVG